MIQQKPIHVAPPWLQHMFLHMQKYDCTIQYKPGKDMVVANCLSCFPYTKQSLPIRIAQNLQHLQLSSAELDIVWGSVECDLVYSNICCLTLRGWPNHRQQVLWITRHFWVAQDELSVKLGLLKRTWVYIPTEILDCTLADLHGAHQGIHRMQA